MKSCDRQTELIVDNNRLLARHGDQKILAIVSVSASSVCARPSATTKTVAADNCYACHIRYLPGGPKNKTILLFAEYLENYQNTCITQFFAHIKANVY